MRTLTTIIMTLPVISLTACGSSTKRKVEKKEMPGSSRPTNTRNVL